MRKGGGIYLRKITHATYGSPPIAAKIAADHKMKNVALMCIWQTKSRSVTPNSVSTVAEYANFFKDKGIEPWLWGYPRPGGETEYVETMSRYTNHACGAIRGWLQDPEKPYKWRFWQKAKRVFSKQASSNLVSMVERNCLDIGCGVTSYGAAHLHKRFPWSEFSLGGFGSPQVYNASEDLLKKCIRSWDCYGFKRLVPSIATFGTTPQKLDKHLSSLSLSPYVDGFLAWSWPQTSKADWDVLAQWSDHFASK